jgi:hypothetical protein
MPLKKVANRFFRSIFFNILEVEMNAYINPRPNNFLDTPDEETKDIKRHRKPYVKPHLITHGDIRDVTMALSPGNFESSFGGGIGKKES